MWTRSRNGHLRGTRLRRRVAVSWLSRVAAVIIALAACVLAWAPTSQADMWIPPNPQVTFRFQLEGKPYVDPVHFAIRCYGDRTGTDLLSEPVPWLVEPKAPATGETGSGGDLPEEVYRFEGICPEYGCKLEATRLPVPFKRIEYCDMDLVLEGRPMTIPEYAHSHPYELCNPGRDGDEEAGLVRWGDYCLSVSLPASTGLTGSSSWAAVGVKRAAGAYRSWLSSILSAIRAGTSSLLGSYGARFQLALLMTLAIEVPVLFAMARLAFRARCGDNRRTILVGVLASSLTLPLLWFAMHVAVDPKDMLILGEVAVAVVEAVLYKALLGVSVGQAAVLSTVANALSFSVGLMLS